MSKLILGIELGSTRIKSVLMDETTTVLAQGSFEWENSLIDGLWTYSLEEVENGLQQSYKDLKKNYGKKIESLDAIGISAMMHGYLAFNEKDELLVPFRTWRNTNTKQASEALSECFKFNIPMRWSIAHYYQAILNNEDHIKEVAYLTTLAGYVHYKLTGKKVLGVGDASGMFPIKNKQYDLEMIQKFNELSQKHGVDKDLLQLLPSILLAGEDAGSLTECGASYLDPSGELKAGAYCCPAEGDAGTGMVATNSILPKTANVSAGTSAFLMAVLEKDLSNYYEEIDMVTTPCGDPVAMVHVNNFTSEINEWTRLFEEVAQLSNGTLNIEKLFKKSLESDEDTGLLTGFNFQSGEPIAKVEVGRPLITRLPEGNFNLANMMQYLIYSSLGTLSMGMDILKKEDVSLEAVCGHGGFFKTEFVGQNAMSAAIEAPVTVMKNAGEGGAWGIALLALYGLNHEKTLDEFLNEVFKDAEKTKVMADEKEIQKFNKFMTMYKKALVLEAKACEIL